MNWFLTVSMTALSGVGQVVPHTIRAVLSGGGTSEDDADATGTTVAITTSTATPIDIVIRVAAYFAFPIVFPSPWRNDGDRVRCRASRWKLSLACG